MKNLIPILSTFCLIVILSGCSNKDIQNYSQIEASGVGSGKTISRVKARYEFAFGSSPTQHGRQSTIHGKPITMSRNSIPKVFDFFSFIKEAYAASTIFSMDSSSVQSTYSAYNNNLINFAQVSVAQLYDNNLNGCAGPCTVASIRAYITGTNDGLYDSVTNQTIPLYLSLMNGTAGDLMIPLLAAPVILETYNLNPSDTSVQVSSFNPAPVFDFSADFTQAGAGTYSANVVFEYVLSN